MIRVSAGARLHFGFGNLSLSHERIYGAIGVALEEPRVVLTAARSDVVDCDHPIVAEYAEQVVDLLNLPGARLRVEQDLPRHAGLGSGTQFALATLAAIARVYDHDPRVRERAPELGRGGRSGIGVAAFESGGFVLDAGHPTTRFTTDRPSVGEWTVPAVAAHHSIPDDWRFLIVIPEVPRGRSGSTEDESMRAVVESADPELGDRIAGIIARRLLPAVAEGAVERFGAAVAEIGRLNGAWYADEQGGVYRPPVGGLVASLSESPAVYGAGQSSWGPTVYGVTDVDRADEALAAGEAALRDASVEGDVFLTAGRNHGARVSTPPND